MNDTDFDPGRLVWLKAISRQPRNPPDIALLFHLETEDGSTFPLSLDHIIRFIDRLILTGGVPSWRDGGAWRQSVGPELRRDSALDIDQNIMLEALVAQNDLTGSRIDSLLELDIGEETPVLITVGVFLQCLSAAVWLGALPPLDPAWAQAAIPDWLAKTAEKIRIVTP